MLVRSRIHINYRDEQFDCVTQYFDYSVTGWRHVLTLTTQLIFVIAFYLFFWKSKLNPNVERRYKSPTTENAYTETREYLLLYPDVEYK